MSSKGQMTVQSTCGGGSVGGGSGSNVPNNNNDVKNNLKDPCLKALVNILLQSNIENKITDILNNVFGTGSSINLYFQEDYTITKDANTIPYVIQGTNTLTKIVTNINPNNFDPNASKEYKTAVIMHEIIHAYLDVNPSVLSNMTQHSYMLENYIDILSGSLQNFFPNMTTDQATSLALYGLGPDVINSTAFADALKKYGFDNNGGPTSYARYAQEFEFGGLGEICNSDNSKGK
jgi:hypothetical protein